MATIKSYTDIEQSKKLAEILPIESADYYHATDAGIIITTSYITYFGEERCIPAYDGAVPCWSLAALLGVLPYPYIEQNYKGKWICRVEHENTTYLWEDSNPIDACVAMIEKLHKLNLL